MNRFLQKLALGMAKVVVAFVLVSVAARFIQPLNWFFFQKNEHDRVFYTLLEVEKALSKNMHYDVLMFGSSTCENAIDPSLFTEKTGLTIFKFVTGAQTIDMAVHLARYCAPIMKPRYVIIDAYPRYGGALTEEGVERAVINAPDASSKLTREILSVYKSSLTTDYLWLARAIGTGIKPYAEKDIVPKPWEFEMIAPGYSRSVNDVPSKSGKYFEEPLVKDAILSMNALQEDLAKANQGFLAIIPPLQNAKVVLEISPSFPIIVPLARPDSCYFDGRHMRSVCIPSYTFEIADRFNAYRATVEKQPQL